LTLTLVAIACQRILVRDQPLLAPDTTPSASIDPGDDGVLTLALLGDSGRRNDTQRAVAAALERVCEVQRCDAAIGLGDNVYPDGVSRADDPLFREAFEDTYGHLPFTFFMALGNHDHHGCTRCQVEYSARSRVWRMPAAHYAVDSPLATIIVLDTTPLHGYGGGGDDTAEPQWRWFEHTLRAAPARPWRIVAGHHPVVSDGWHGDADEDVKSRMLSLLCGAVDFHLAGHDHDLNLLETPGCGTRFVISGAAQDTRPVHAGPRSRFAADDPGFALLRLAEREATLTFHDRRGEVLHEARFGPAQK
jgi:hypothetical protein